MKSIEKAMLVWVMLLLLGQLAATPIARAADDITETLTAAKQKHAATTKELSEAFILSIGEKIKSAATTGELDRVKELIAFKESFEAGGGIPADPDLAEDALRYVSSRKASASQLFNAYQSVIRDYTTKLQISEATALDTEMKEFIAAERQAMQIGSSRSPADPMEEESSRTKENFEEWHLKYLEMMDEISAEPTTAKQENAHREFVKRIDDRLKQQTWTFHCRINDVDVDDGEVTIQFDPPEETPSLDNAWRCLTSTASLKFTKQQALALIPGDILVITGSPRFVAAGYSRGAFFTRETRVGGRSVDHSILITKFRHSVRKQNTSAKSEAEK